MPVEWCRLSPILMVLAVPLESLGADVFSSAAVCGVESVAAIHIVLVFLPGAYEHYAAEEPLLYPTRGA